MQCTPLHTPACMTYIVSDATESAAFVGDTLFMPDYGTARCDFPAATRTLYRSIRKGPVAAATRPASTCATTTVPVAAELSPRDDRCGTTCQQRTPVRDGISERIRQHAQRTGCDTEMPVLILPSVQVKYAGR